MSLKIIYSTSVWDLKSAKEIVKLKPKFIKIGSATNTNYDVIQYILKNYTGKIHVSLGMTTQKEEKKLIDLFIKFKDVKILFYTYVPAYPVKSEDTCLLEIKRLINDYKNKNLVMDIGFSGHHKGIAIDIAAYALGANFIERHFTLDRTWKGTDHSASLEPDGIRRLQRNLEETYKALSYKKTNIRYRERS